MNDVDSTVIWARDLDGTVLFGEPIIERYESQQRALESKVKELETVIQEIAK